ncbi:hypothetical protein IYY11_19380 [Methylocystis sp. H62]|uniref:hypothetical protein n=1 Tax=Methylocystis sp. H62 TaxID=2785789 RepID=UPI0018C21EED|nr:hypothetical protein [Methylocystis sp. H62]MBG0795520.1 hypothetical protein [Methylocystis sp. H62]
MKIRFTIDDIAAARDAGAIDAASFERLSQFLASRRAAAAEATSQTPRYDVVNLLWYAGALIVLGAMGMFSTTAFGLWGDKALLVTAIVYAAMFAFAGAYLWHRRGLHTPGGLLIACAVGMAPLAIFALQSMFGVNPAGEARSYGEFYVWVKSSWLPMELGTIAAASVALLAFPFPFLVMIIAFALWFMSMDLTPWLMGVAEFSWDQRATVSMYFGLVVLAVAWLVDLKRWRNGDFAFWLHLFGLLAFWGGLTAQHSGDELGKALYCAVNVGLIFLSLFLMRRVYAVFGAVGVTTYLSYLASSVFKDSILFPFALSGIGVLLIVFGLLFHRYGAAVGETIGELLPGHLRGLRPAHAREQDSA